MQTSTTKDQSRNMPPVVHTACAPLVRPEQPLKGEHYVPYTQKTQDKVRDLSHSCKFTAIFARQTNK